MSLLSFSGTLVSVKSFFSLYLGLLDFERKDNVMLHPDGLKMEEKFWTHGKFIRLSMFYQGDTARFLPVAMCSSVCSFSLYCFDDVDRSQFFKIATRS